MVKVYAPVYTPRQTTVIAEQQRALVGRYRAANLHVTGGAKTVIRRLDDAPADCFTVSLEHGRVPAVVQADVVVHAFEARIGDDGLVHFTVPHAYYFARGPWLIEHDAIVIFVRVIGVAIVLAVVAVGIVAPSPT